MSDTIRTPDWQAMMTQPPTGQDDGLSLAEMRLAHAALTRGAWFMARSFGIVDAQGSIDVGPGTDPEARAIIEELAGARRMMADAIFRLTGKEV